MPDRESPPASQVGTTLGQTTVGFLQQHPDVNYLYSPYDPAAAFQVPAIQQAGLADKVKVVSILGDQQNLDFIRSGTVQAADAAYDNEYMGYAMVDQMIRSLDKQPISEPDVVRTCRTVARQHEPAGRGSDWHAPFDYKAEFLKLWGK